MMRKFPANQDTQFHLIIGADERFSSLIPLMAPNGTIYPLTVDFTPSKLVMFHVAAKGIRIQGSVVISTSEMRKMLQFCARHKITPQIEKFPLNETGMSDAMRRLTDGKVRYRAVLVAQN